MHRGNGLLIESSLKRRKAAAAVVGRADLTTRARPEEKVAAFFDIPPSARGSHRIARCAIKAPPASALPTTTSCAGDPITVIEFADKDAAGGVVTVVACMDADTTEARDEIQER